MHGLVKQAPRHAAAPAQAHSASARVGYHITTHSAQFRCYYCSEKCAKLAWRAGHKQECKALRAAAEL